MGSAPGPDREPPASAEAEIVDLGGVTHATVSGRDRWAVSVAIVVGVVIVATGIVLAARPDLTIMAASPTPSVAESPLGSDAVVVASPRPTPTLRPSGAPRPSSPPPTPAPCLRTGDDSLPDIRLSTEVGSTGVVNINSGFGSTGDPRAVPWTEAMSLVRDTAPDLIARVGINGRIVLSTSDGACLVRAEATFADFRGAEPLEGAIVAPSDAARRTITVAPPAPGEWVVRLLTEFEGTSGLRWMESYARVRVGETIAPPIQWVTPARACGTGTGPADLDLYIDDVRFAGWPWSGVAGATAPPSTAPVRVPVGSVVEVRIAGDRCAVTWRIEARKRATTASGGPEIQVESYVNNAPNPAVAAQNRFRMDLGLGLATWDMTGSVQLADRTSIVAAWVLEMDGLVAPPLMIGRQDRSARVQALPGPCASVSLRNGHSTNGHFTGESCATNLPASPLATLIVPVGSRLTFAAPGWTVEYWQASTGTIRGEPPVFEYTEGGFLRSASSPPVEFTFPATTGRRTLGLNACLERDGNRTCGDWFVTIDVR